jgi:hypothetical protein
MTVVKTDGATAPASEFAALLDDLSAFQKSLTADDTLDGAGDGDTKIADAAADGADEGGDTPPASDGDDSTMGKALKVTLADGSEVDAWDGTEMVKALQAETQTLHGIITGLRTDALAGQTALIDAVKQQGTMIKSQDAMIKSLQADITKLSGAGTGRRSMVSMHEKPVATPVVPVAPTQSDLMSKAHALQAQGKLTGAEVCLADNYLRHGHQLPDDLAKALSI